MLFVQKYLTYLIMPNLFKMRMVTCLFVIFIMHLQSANSQTNSIAPSLSDTVAYNNALKALERQTYDFVHEKVYLHLDKPYYSKGDNLWFKAYTVAGPNHTPSPLSENLYVELINKKDSVIKRLTVYLNKGLGNGDFNLADSLQSGKYTIRAYTNWMLNFDKDFFFQRQFQLIDPIYNKPETKPETDPTFQISFYPEGGELITNLSSKVAFEIPNHLEKLPIEIIDDLDQIITTAETVHQGMGSFELKPLEGRTYFAKINGTAAKHALPKVRNQGLVFSVDNITSDEEVIVNIKSTAAKEQQNEVFLIAHTRGLIGFSSKVEWKGGSAKVTIPKKKLIAGLVHVTLFDENWNPEAERLIFKKQNTDSIKVTLKTDQNSYKIRDSTLVKLTIQSGNGEPLKGFFSLSVFDTKQINPNDISENILSSIYLSSDIRGALKNPLQYFDTDNPKASQDLDLLLLTKGWRRFVWKDILDGKFQETKFEVEQGFDVSGKVTQKSSNKPVSKARVKQIGSFYGLPSFKETTTKSNGTFELKNLLYHQDVSLIQAQNKKGKNNVILKLDEIITPIFNNVVSPNKDVYFSPITIEEHFLAKSRDRKTIDSVFSFENVTDLGTVIVEGTKNNLLSSNISRGLVFNRGEYSLNVTDLMANGQRFINALYLLQGRIPGITFVAGESGEPRVSMTRKVWSLNNPDPPTLFFIDDSPTSIGAVTAMPAEIIARVEVLKGMRATGIYGPRANGGVIAFYTKNPDEFDEYYDLLSQNNLSPKINSQPLGGGYYKSRVFYAPNYSSELPGHFKPDYRDLIHWEPMIKTDENGEATIKFFNADLPTTIQINLEGIWEGGIPLATSISYEVKKK